MKFKWKTNTVTYCVDHTEQTMDRKRGEKDKADKLRDVTTRRPDRPDQSEKREENRPRDKSTVKQSFCWCVKGNTGHMAGKSEGRVNGQKTEDEKLIGKRGGLLLLTE